MDAENTVTRAGEPSTAPSGPALEGTRFAAGVVLAGRYRVVALLGRGGMGEVYRADDLKLRQPVALKFLPASLAADPLRLARLMDEVRMARQVSHPNVCRVHDIAEVDGQTFLSMEYVDGEDLGSLLRRIGRLPLDKASEVGRQVSAGLAAAHDRGVLHRDLKPANVMIDGRGRARIADFGLAVDAGGQAGGGDIAGTPAYMPPEQAEGRPLSPRTDIYALGLVLYEVFTGRSPFQAGSAPEMARLHREAPPPRPSAVVPEIPAAIEDVILRCLAKDAERRPASALSVAAALSGVDPLAAFLAAGETPPPEMVAAAEPAAAMSRVQAWAGLAFVAVGLPLGLYLSERMILLKQVPLPKPPQVLSDRAAELARSLLGAGGEASAYGFVYDESLEGHQVLPVPARAKLPRAPIQFWYRVAPRRLDAINPYGAVTPRDPPPTEPGMAELRLDTRGRLLRFDGVQGLDAPSGGPPPDWAPAFREAGLDLSRFRPAAPALVPRVYADVRLAWDGEDPEEPGHALRVEAAAFGDRPVIFRILDGPPTAPGTPRRRGALTFNLIFLAMLPVAAVAARRNVRLGRGDRRGALRLAAFAFAARLLAWVLEAPYERLARGDLALLAAALSRALYSAAVLWLFYMAIEPSLRRRWPEALISWSRVLAGRFRDPRVGRDVLMGVVTAVAMALTYSGGRLLAKGFGASPALHLIVDLDILLGLRPFLASFLLNQVNAISGGLFFMLALLLTRVLVRDLRVAAALWAVLLTSMSAVGAGISHWAEMISVLVVIGLLIGLILRFGLLALIVTSFLLGPSRAFVPFTLDLGAWYGQAALAWLLVGLTLAVFGFYASMAGRPLLGGRLLD